jgi:hypothetical protein
LGFIATTMDFAVMGTAKRHRELIAHLAAQGRMLRHPHMMSIRRLAPADETRLS